MNLSPTALKNIKKLPPGTILNCPVVPRLRLRVGARVHGYSICYRVRGSGRERRLTIGRHPWLTLPAARKIAVELLSKVTLGEDPGAFMDRPQGTDMKSIVEAYLAYQGNKKSLPQKRRLLVNHALPELNKLDVTQVSMDDIERLHALHTGTPYQANRMLAELSSLFTYAERKGIRDRDTNPCKYIRPFPERPHVREITPTEARRIAEVIRSKEKMHPQGTLFLWILIYSGARPGEIAAATWADVSIHDDGFSTIELRTHKTDRYVDSRTVYIPPAVTALYPERTCVSDGESIAGIEPPRRLWEKIRKIAGVENIRMYDLRHWFASVVIATGHTHADVALLYQHANVNTSRRYTHTLHNRACAIVGDVSSYLDTMMGQK